MLGSPAGPGGPSQRGLWPLAPAPAPSATTFSSDGLSKYGVYSLFPGGPAFGSALYSHASTIGRFASGHIQQSSGNTFHTAHKVSDSLYSATGYTFGTSTPPPVASYSPIPVAQLELLTKGYSNNIIIQQAPDFPPSPRKVQITEKRCDEKCCSIQKSQKSCHCPSSPIKKIQEISLTGCSRTNPIEWTGVNVKKEPGTPCQVAEITTSVSPVVKLEVTSPTQKHGTESINIGGSLINNGAQIPVGIAVARQRVQHELVASPSLPPAGLLATLNSGGGAQIKEIDNAGTVAGMAASTSGAVPGGGTVLQCADERTTGLAAWQVGGTHNQTLTTPTLWQYPAPVPMEPMVPLPVPTMPPMGLQLVREPTTGGFLLLPTTTGIEPLQQTVVWPSYPQPSSVLLPSLSSMPPPPLQLLSSASSDYLSSSTTLHQHTQTHSTRLVAVTTDAKRKIPLPLPATTLIKIETDGTLDQSKTLQAVSSIAGNTGSVFTDQTPLVTTHVIYQHPTNLIVSQAPNFPSESALCRSQATSPVMASLTPPPEPIHIQEEEHANTSAVQDASNQTDIPICSEDDNTTHAISDVTEEKTNNNVILANRYLEEHQTVDEQTEIVPEVCENHETVEIKPLQEISSSEKPCSETNINSILPKETEQPDLSGLELLSNSIVEMERTKQHIDATSSETLLNTSSNTSSTESTETDTPKDVNSSISPIGVDDNLGGLDLLCALAEQRIMEEKIEKPEKKAKSDKSREKHKEKERKREKRKSKKHSSDEPKRKKIKSEKHRSSEERHREKEHRKKEKRHRSSEKYDFVSENVEKEECACKYKHYKTPESEQEVKKFLESKARQNYCCKGEWPCMNPMELDIRMQLAEIQRNFREKQKELSKLKPKKHSHHRSDCSRKKSRKKSTHSERSDTPPPDSNKVDSIINDENKSSKLLRPSKLNVIPKLEETCKRKYFYVDSIQEKHSSSKKRKVGRPKRLMGNSGEVVLTETIVARKLKNNFVGCLLAAKEKLKQQNNNIEYPDCTPPRYIEETYTHKLKKVKSNHNIVTVDETRLSKIRPKLKAEATIKVEDDDDVNEWQSEEEDDKNVEQIKGHMEQEVEDEIEENKTSCVINKVESTVNKAEEEILSAAAEVAKSQNVVIEEIPNACTLTDTHLEMDKLRVLTAMGGLFYAGQLNAIEPPDVYSITLDGERGNKPHIMSREEILRDAIVEVSPKTTEEVPAGTRLCAYWSQQYRCLYPGTAAEPGMPEPNLDRKFIPVEFDDGDSGTIAIQDIRLLPPNYPIVEYDPNPLLSLSKRKRRTSTSISTEEKHISEALKPIVQKAYELVTSTSDTLTTPAIAEQTHKDKKKTKKRKREKSPKEKQLEISPETESKKKKKKHKKHKKHRKHHNNCKDDSGVSVETLCPQYDTHYLDAEEELNSTEDKENNSKFVHEVEPQNPLVQSTNLEDDISIDGSINSFDENPVAGDEETAAGCLPLMSQEKKTRKSVNRRESGESSRSKISAFLPATQKWHWAEKEYKKARVRGKVKKYYKGIQQGKKSVQVGDSAVFLSTGRPDRPFVGHVTGMWELNGNMTVKVNWYYYPEETEVKPKLQIPGALFSSGHSDENDVQTISHRCDVLPLSDFVNRLGNQSANYEAVYEKKEVYYLAGSYNATAKELEVLPDIPLAITRRNAN